VPKNSRVVILDDAVEKAHSQTEQLKIQIKSLQQRNLALEQRLNLLENEIQTLKQGLAERGQTEQNQVDKQDPEQSVEDELSLDLTWLDETCPFKKADGRTWRQMAVNQGEKIPMNGRGPQVPRMYLHSIENWKDAVPEIRIKAKLALRLGRN